MDRKKLKGTYKIRLILFTISLIFFIEYLAFGQKIEIIPRSVSLQFGSSIQLSTSSKIDGLIWSTNNPNIQISKTGLVSTSQNQTNSLKTGYIYVSNSSNNVLDSVSFTLTKWITNKSKLTYNESYENFLYLGHSNDSVFTYNLYKSPQIYLSLNNIKNPKPISTFHKIKTPTYSNFIANKFGYIIKDSTDISFSKNLKDWELVYKTRTNSFRNSTSQYYDSLKNKIYFFTGDYHTIDSLPCSVYRGEISSEGIYIKPVFTFSSRTEYSKNKGSYPQARHVHVTAIDPYTNDIWVGTGDNDNENFLMYSQDNGNTWKVLGTGSQEWRTLSFWFTNGYIYWNMDTGKNQKVFRISRSKYAENNSWPCMTPVLNSGNTKPGLTYFIKKKGDPLDFPNKEGTFFTETIVREINGNTELIVCNDLDYDYREIVANLENSAHWLSMTVVDKKGDQIILMSTDAEGKVLDDFSRIFGFKERVDGTVDVQEVFSVKSSNKYSQMMPCFQNSEKSVFYWGYYTDWKIHKMELDWNDNSESVGGVVTEEDRHTKFSENTRLQLTGYDGQILKWQMSDKSYHWKNIENTRDTLTVIRTQNSVYYRAIVKKDNHPPVSSIPAEIRTLIWTDSSKIKNSVNNFMVTPVPAKDHLNVFGLNVTDNVVDMEIFNTGGSCIYRRRLTSKSKLISETINLPIHSSGIYFVKISGIYTYLNQKIILY